MPGTFQLEVATPERLLLREQVSEAQIPALNGYIGVLPEHAPLISKLGTGELSYQTGGRRLSLVVSGGYVEVLGDQTRVLADSAEKTEEIDLARAQAALDRAQKRLATPEANLDVGRALNALKRAEARLAAAKAR
jgi:F-type H+-transporting ATPase subunit epsilon